MFVFWYAPWYTKIKVLHGVSWLFMKHQLKIFNRLRLQYLLTRHESGLAMKAAWHWSTYQRSEGVPFQLQGHDESRLASVSAYQAWKRFGFGVLVGFRSTWKRFGTDRLPNEVKACRSRTFMATVKAGWLQYLLTRHESGLASVSLSDSGQHESGLALIDLPTKWRLTVPEPSRPWWKPVGFKIGLPVMKVVWLRCTCSGSGQHESGLALNNSPTKWRLTVPEPSRPWWKPVGFKIGLPVMKVVWLRCTCSGSGQHESGLALIDSPTKWRRTVPGHVWPWWKPVGFKIELPGMKAVWLRCSCRVPVNMKAVWLQDRVASDETSLVSVSLSGSGQHESGLGLIDSPTKWRRAVPEPLWPRWKPVGFSICLPGMKAAWHWSTYQRSEGVPFQLQGHDESRLASVFAYQAWKRFGFGVLVGV